MNAGSTKTNWHLLLGRLLYLALEPVGVQVLVDVPLLSEAPKADILLLRRSGESWSTEQRRWLADGLRHVSAGHLLIEFKRSESLTLKALQQLNAYDHFYRVGSRCKLRDVACFLISARTPRGDWQSRLGFTTTEWPGVYRGAEILSKRVQVLLLNELEPTAYNAPLKLFATQLREQGSAFVAARNSGFARLSEQLEQLIDGLWRLYMPKVRQTEDLTPERVMEMGREWLEATLKAAPLEDVLHFHNTDEVLSHYKPEQLASVLTSEQRLSGLTVDQIRDYLERLQQANT